jgi:serine/threonine-protein kinase
MVAVTTIAIACEACGQEDLASRASAVLLQACGDCHGPDGDEKQFIEPTLVQLVKLKRVTPGNASGSRIFAKLIDTNPETRMPKGSDPLAKEDIELIRRWIDTGARPAAAAAAGEHGTPHPPPDAKKRTVLGFEHVIDQVHAHLQSLDPRDRPFQRYFLFHNIHNHPKRTSADLRTARAAVSKAANSLSWNRKIVLPKPIDPDQVILAVDLRDLGWQEDPKTDRPNLWRRIAAAYPYGLSHESFPDDVKLREKWGAIDEQTGTAIPWLRGDWFVVNAFQPPLYHEVLYDLVLPELRDRQSIDVKLANDAVVREKRMTEQDLEQALGVDARQNIRDFAVHRSGNKVSGVSSGPRILERHETRFGAYWKSYDFRKGNFQKPATDIAVHPLGPDGVFPDALPQSFVHDGGEIIFNLPNGMQGYLLADGRGNRIPVGPIDVVFNRSGTGKEAQIINGISCASCHEFGMKDDNTVDTIRGGLVGLPPVARDMVRRLYVDPQVFRRDLDEDIARFTRADRECTQTFRNQDEAGEPITVVWGHYAKDMLGVAEMAAELGVPEQRLAPELKHAGLASVAAGHPISREEWEQRGREGRGASLFQRVAQQLGDVGTPVSH